MPKYYCDYCDAYLTHDSPNVRKTHFQGRKHRDNVKLYYQKWMEEQAQQLIDATTAAYKAGKIVANPFATAGAAIPPPVVRPQVAAQAVSVAPPPIIMNPLAAAVRPPILPIRPILAVPPPAVQTAIRR